MSARGIGDGTLSADQKICKILDAAAEKACQTAFCRTKDSACESEIERVMLAAFLAEEMALSRPPFLALGDLSSRNANFIDAKNTASEFLKRGHPKIDIIVVPQVSIEEYRADFGCFGLDINQTISLLAVECDGHEFHEKTKEQAKRDKRRDRAFLVNDIPVMRFTGAEIWRDADECVRQVQQYFMHLAYYREVAA